MISVRFRTNRASFPTAELAKYCGQWVAFSSDGTRVLAADASIARIESQLKAAGFSPNEVVLERVPGLDEDMYLGAQELI